jgi:ribosome-binding factor A
MTSRRILRINELIRDELAELLRRAIKDPGLDALISITEVKTSPDLRQARVYVSVLADEERQREVLKRLRHAAGFLRHELGPRLHLRYNPQLAFELDPSIARGARVLQILREISAERPPAEEEPESRSTDS